jgi:subtilisin family serine protease
MQATADSAQASIWRQLAGWRAGGEVSKLKRLWVIDGFALTATRSVVDQIAARADVASVTPDATIEQPAYQAAPATAPEPNIDLIGAPTLWQLGYNGKGVVVANLDTGVSLANPDLAASWRGGTDSWFDPYGQHSTPVDLSGHGTATMGVMVGGSSGGTDIGVAPGAQWIAAKIFNDQGQATVSAIDSAFQWLLDPDGNPATADAPNVVEGSWTTGGPGCDLTFEPALEALRSAGILPVFAAGNSGPSSGTSYSPANNPAAFGVGSTDDSDVIAPDSSRGPSACTGDQSTFPDLTAPGVNIHTAGLFGTYVDDSGTSLAAPHVAGALALLLQAFPGTSAASQEAALDASAVDLGPAGPDDTYGNGRLDAAAAYSYLSTHSHPAMLLSIKAGFTNDVGNLKGVQRKDVISYDGSKYAMVFDASDVGVGSANLDAVTMLGPKTLLMSFAQPVTLPGVGQVKPTDIVRFDATSLGENTAGTFSLWFHGSDVGLSTPGEGIDALGVLPDGRVLISTRGWANVPGLPAVHKQDVLAFTPTSLGPVTAGRFSYYIRGSKIGLTTSTENIDAIAVQAGGLVDLSTTGPFSVAGVSGSGDDVFQCSATSLGPNTACKFSPALVLDGASAGLGGLGVDAFSFSS